MADQITEVMIYDIGDFIVRVMGTWLGIHQDGSATPISYVNTVHRGFRSVIITVNYDPSPDNVVYIIMCVILAAGETCPAMYVANSSNRAIFQVGYNIVTGDPTWAAQLTLVETYAGFAARDVLTNMCNSFCTQKPAIQIQAANNRIASGAIAIEVLTDALAFVYTIQVFACDAAISPEQAVITAPVVNSPVQVVNGFGGKQLEGIAKSVQQIADTDYNISINHGQSIFSVKGKVLT